VLVFIGVKLVLHFAHEHRAGVPEISTGLSLAVIAALLGTATVASLAAARRDPGLRARAGSLRGHRHREPPHGR
jgi:tellurite resistance protein TerC